MWLGKKRSYKSSSGLDTVKIVNKTARITNFFESNRATFVHPCTETSVVEQQVTNCADLATQTDATQVDKETSFPDQPMNNEAVISDTN